MFDIVVHNAKCRQVAVYRKLLYCIGREERLLNFQKIAGLNREIED